MPTEPNFRVDQLEGNINRNKSGCNMTNQGIKPTIISATVTGMSKSIPKPYAKRNQN